DHPRGADDNRGRARRHLGQGANPRGAGPVHGDPRGAKAARDDRGRGPLRHLQRAALARDRLPAAPRLRCPGRGRRAHVSEPCRARRVTFGAVNHSSLILASLIVAGGLSAGCSSDSQARAACGVPASFAWSSSPVLLAPISDATHDLVSIRDPSVVFFDGKWHVFVSTVDANGGYRMAYITFPDWDHTADATLTYLDQTPTLRGYHAAPQVFFFAPQNKWYLVYQSGPPQDSTNDEIRNPYSTT